MLRFHRQQQFDSVILLSEFKGGASRMIPFGAGGSRRFTAAVPVTPASATGGAAAPPLVNVKIDQDTAVRDAEPVPPKDAGTTTQTPTRNVRRPPSAPPTTPMASTSHRLEYNLRSASKSSTPESCLVANYTTPTTIATLSEVSKILPTITSSRGNDDDESPSSLTNNQQNHMSVIKDRNGKVNGENIIDSPITNGASKSTRSNSISTSSTTTTTIGATTVGTITKESSNKIKISKDPESSPEPMDATTATSTTTEKMMHDQRATATPSAPAALTTSTTTKVDENSDGVSPRSSKHDSNGSKAEVKMTDVGATSFSANDMPSKVIRVHVAEDSSNKKKDNDDDDDDDKSSESKTNDAIHPAVIKCPSPSSKGGIAKMKADDGSVPTAKTGDTSNPFDRLFAFDPNNMDEVLDLGVNEFETIIIGPTPNEYVHDNLHGARDHRSFGTEEYAYHHHHGPDEQEHYDPPMDSHRHQQYYSNPHQYPRYHPKHHPRYHPVGVVSPVTTNIMAARLANEVPRSFSDAVAHGFRFQDEVAYRYVDGIDRATGAIVAKSLPWSPIKMCKLKKMDQKPQTKLPTDRGITVVSVKVGGVEIFDEDEEPSCPHPHPRPSSPRHDDHPQPHIGMTSQVQYHHPTDHQTVVSVLHSSPPNSPTPSVSSASMQEAVLKVREEFSNGGRYDSLGTSSFICNTNHDAGVQVYGSTFALPVPHTIVFGTGRDRRSASSRTSPSMSTFGMPASPGDTNGHFVDAHVPTFINTTPNELRNLGVPHFSKEDSDVFCSIMSPLTTAGVEEGDGLTAKECSEAIDEKSAPSTTNEYPKQVWTGIVEGDSDSPFKKLAHAVNNASNFAATSVNEGTANGVIDPPTLPTVVTGSSITGRTGGPKKKGSQTTSIRNKKAGRVGVGAVTTKARAENKSIAKTPKATIRITIPATSKPMLKRLSGEIQTWAHDALCTADEYRTIGGVWCEKFDELVIFKNKYGHCNPPPIATTLSAWVHLQRSALSFVKDDPPKSQVPLMKKKLDSIGFTWTHSEGVTETELRCVRQEECKAVSGTSKEDVKSTKSTTQAKKKPTKRAKSSVKKSNPRPTSITKILPPRKVKADVVGSGAPEKNAGSTIGVGVAVEVETELPELVSKTSTKDTKKSGITKNASKGTAKKNTSSIGLSNAEKRNQCCSVDGCTKFRQGGCKGMCRAHYNDSTTEKHHEQEEVDDAGDYDDLDENWRKVEPSDLIPNARVLILYNKQLYRATVRECPNKKGGKYRIHYDGWSKAKSELVPFSMFCALLDEDNHPLEMTETSDDGNGLVYSVQVFVYSDGKTDISSIEANGTAADSALAATEAVADLAINLEWRQCLESLVLHQKQYGCIPPERTKAYKWFVKQAHEYSRKKIGRRSSLTVNQIALLEQRAGFVFRDGTSTATKRQYDEMANYGETTNSESLPKQKMKKN